MKHSLWKPFPLFLSHAIALLSLLSLIHPLTASFWNTIDLSIFKFLNETLRESPGIQLFWALANHKNADWLSDVIIIAFFLSYAKQLPSGERYKAAARLVCCALIMVSTIYLFNRKLVPYIDIKRASPSRTVENCVLLSKELPHIHIKDASKRSFPGDHATTALLFALLFSNLPGTPPSRHLRLLAASYALFLCLPRLVVGAHWPTDVAIGSGALATSVSSWFFFSPLGPTLINLLERSLLVVRLKGSTRKPST